MQSADLGKLHHPSELRRLYRPRDRLRNCVRVCSRSTRSCNNGAPKEAGRAQGSITKKEVRPLATVCEIAVSTGPVGRAMPLLL